MDGQLSATVEHAKDRSLQAVSQALRAVGVVPDYLNIAGAVLAGFAAACYASSNLSIARFAFPFYLGSGACDGLDGSLARHMGIADAAGAGKDHVADRISDALLAAAVMWRGFSRDNGLLVVAGALLATSFAPAMMKQLALRADIPAAGLPKLAIGSRVVRFAFVAVALALPVLGVANGSVHVQALLFAVAGILGDITALARLRVALTRTGGIRPFLKDVTRSREMSSSLQPGEISDSHKKMAVVVAVSIPLIPIFLRLLAK